MRVKPSNGFFRAHTFIHRRRVVVKDALQRHGAWHLVLAMCLQFAPFVLEAAPAGAAQVGGKCVDGRLQSANGNWQLCNDASIWRKCGDGGLNRGAKSGTCFSFVNEPLNGKSAQDGEQSGQQSEDPGRNDGDSLSDYIHAFLFGLLLVAVPMLPVFFAWQRRHSELKTPNV